MTAHTSSLELYIGVKPGENHTLILVEGLSRTAKASRPDEEAMYAEAVRLMEENGTIKPELRIIDASRRIVRCGDIRFSLDKLKGWQQQARAA